MRGRNLATGFTMIELLMVIMIVSILGAVALPQFLDFRNEGRLASLRQLVATVRVGIKNQEQNALLRCNATTPVLFCGDLLINNDVTSGPPPIAAHTRCTTAQIPNAAERRFFDSGTTLDNPFTSDDSIEMCTNSSCSNHCSSASCGRASGVFGWCYNNNTNEFWPASNQFGECNF